MNGFPVSELTWIEQKQDQTGRPERHGQKYLDFSAWPSTHRGIHGYFMLFRHARWAEWRRKIVNGGVEVVSFQAKSMNRDVKL
jgi:hypothetical protein